MISIITPLINEKDSVKVFLEHLKALNGNFELIIVDGGSSDGTLKEVTDNIDTFGHKVRLVKTNLGRAVQMNKGAKIAAGNILLFLHVDCIIPKDTLKLIESVISGNKVVGGGFKQTFLKSDFFLSFISVFGNLRSQLTCTFFGDYGIFLRKDVFQKIGGYGDIPFLEDVELCKQAKKFGKLTQIDCYLLTSPRRFLSNGKIKITIIFVLVCLFNFLKFRPRFFIKYMTYK